MLNNNQLKAVLAWIFLFGFIHYLYQFTPSIGVNDEHLKASTRNRGNVKGNAFDAVVYIAMGAVTIDPMVDLSIESVRRIGKYDGDIYIITDRPSCFSDSVMHFNTKIVTTESRESIIMIKSMKPDIFMFLPSTVQNAL